MNFEQDYLTNKSFVVKYILKNSKINDYDQAVEVYHDVWIRYMNACEQPKFSLNVLLSTYLIGICDNVLSEIKRKEKQEKEKLTKIETLPPSSDYDETIDFDIEKLGYLLKTTTTPCQNVITLFYLEGKSHQEIMEILGYSSREVSRNTLNRCLDNLRNLFFEKTKNRKVNYPIPQ